MRSQNLIRLSIVAATSIGIAAFVVSACPFCSVTSQTLSEEMNAADAVVLARLVKGGIPPNADPTTGGFGAIDPDTGTATFEILEILKGGDRLIGVERIDVIFFGPPEKEKAFFITGIGEDKVEWTTPLPVSDAAVEYIRKLPVLPEKGADRLAFFQEFLESEDILLGQDAYDEFARAPYDEVIALGPRMHHDRLIGWITDPEISPSRRRLYFTMLGVCGTQADLPLLEELILSDFRAKKVALDPLLEAGLALGGPVSLPLVTEVAELDERRKKLGLDAMIACYLTLGGADGLDAIDGRFLSDADVEYTHVYSTLMALRFHGEETDIVPRERLLKSVRLLLDHPDFADQVIPDLARWEDWEVLDKLVGMFKSADENSFIKQPVITYLVVASEQEGNVGTRGTASLAELEALDPDTVERARSLMAFGFLARARPEGDGSNYARDAEGESQGESAADDIPDPSSAQFTDTASTNGDPPADVASGSDTSDNGADESTRVASTAGAEPSASPPSTAAAGDSQADVVSTEPPNTAIIVGVPLLATVLLTGLFWLILRAGGA